MILVCYYFSFPVDSVICLIKLFIPFLLLFVLFLPILRLLLFRFLIPVVIAINGSDHFCSNRKTCLCRQDAVGRWMMNRKGSTSRPD